MERFLDLRSEDATGKVPDCANYLFRGLKPPGQVKGGEIALPKCPNTTPYPWLVVPGVVPRHQHRG